MIVAIIQARMGSTRLKGKVMLDLCGKPVLWHVVNRVKKSKKIDKIVVATSKTNDDDIIEEFCTSQKILCFRGVERNVLKRYFDTVKMLENSGCDIQFIVRITADCPLIDPDVIDRTIDHAQKGGFDYVTTSNPPTYPDGIDVEVFTPQALKIAHENAHLPSEKEHVTQYIIKNNIFTKSNVENKWNLSHMRWTLDQQEDYEFIQQIYSILYKNNRIFLMDDVLDVLRQKPDLMKINSHIPSNEGYQKSLIEDKKNSGERI